MKPRARFPLTQGPGFYAMEIAAWRRLESPWKLAGFAFETMSMIALLRALMRSEPLPPRIRIPRLDRMLYQLYRLHEEKGEREALRQVDRVVRQFGSVLYRHRGHLMREGPLVLFTLEYLEHGTYWQAGIRHRGTGEAIELFRLERLFPRCEVSQVDGEVVCFSTF